MRKEQETQGQVDFADVKDASLDAGGGEVSGQHTEAKWGPSFVS